MKRYSALFVLFSICLMTSCSPTLSSFTRKMYQDFRWSDSELKNIQFYLSDDIVLTRDAGSTRSQLSNGSIIIKNGQRMEQVVFRKGTPGVYVFSPGKDRFAISFEDSNNKYLIFGPSKKRSGRFTLLAKEWNRNSGKITYDDRVWTTSYESAYATLLVDLKRADKVKYKSKTAKGRKVGS